MTPTQAMLGSLSVLSTSTAQVEPSTGALANLANQIKWGLTAPFFMDAHTLENWAKVKEALERANKTDSMFYTRAVAILKTGKDPLDRW
jgi:hypothetical protein